MPENATVSLTGHGFGGALAGLAGAAYGAEALVFNTLPFENAAAELEALAQIDVDVQNRFFAGAISPAFSAAGVRQISVEDEVFSILRAVGLADLSVGPGLLDTTALHSLPLLVHLQWAEYQGRTDWRSVQDELWNAFFDAEIALSIPGINGFVGVGGTALATMQAALAYSAIEGSERPFGDTAIWSLFNDMDKLGRLLDSGAAVLDELVDVDPSDGIDLITMRQSLANLAVQYAATLAIGDIEDEMDDAARGGVLDFDALGAVITVDFGASGWSAESAPEATTGIVSALLRGSALADGPELQALYGYASFEALLSAFYSLPLTDIGAVTVPGGETPLDVTLAPGRAEVQVVVGTSGNDRVEIIAPEPGDPPVSRVVITLDEGDDTVTGGDDDDLINTGPGDDFVRRSSGEDTIYGGFGDDLFDLDVNTGKGEIVTIWISPDIDFPFSTFDQARVQFRIVGMAGGEEYKTLLFGFEQIDLTDFSDYVYVSTEDLVQTFPEEVLIDLGGRTEGDRLGDILDFAKNGDSLYVQQGVFYRNGYVQVAEPAFTQEYFDSVVDLYKVIENVEGILFQEDDLVPFDRVQFTNVDSVYLTDEDDRFSITVEDAGTISGTGEILGRGGRDVIFISSITDCELLVDAGSGDDIVIVTGGTAVTTAGGTGRDVIINTTPGGLLYGDTVTGTVINADGTASPVADGSNNADLFYFAPDTTIMDAQKDDVLSFFGVPLTGGGAGASSVAFALGGITGSKQALDAVANSLTYYALVSTAPSLGLMRTYYDTFLPGIAYIAQKDGPFIIANLTDLLFNGVTGLNLPDEVEIAGVSIPTSGVMAIQDFQFKSSGTFDGPWWEDFGGIASVADTVERNVGDFGMLFNFPNVFSTIMGGLGAAAELMRATPGGVNFLFAAFDAVLLADAASWILGASMRVAKAALWVAGGDPLIIDLDGDGIETIAPEQSQIFFDFDDDLFAEASGWLSEDDGFLVRDLNNNDRIDNITGMFGGNTGFGYVDLEIYDMIVNGGNGDGAITAADVVWASLQIWRDLDQDAETDAGELFSLDELGIVSLDLTDIDALNITQPSGAQLFGNGVVEFADGTITRMYEAIFESFQTYTIYAGEAGLAPWQANVQVENKGYGSMTDLSVAVANDIEFGRIVADVSASMTEPDFFALRDQIGPVLSYWGQTMETTRELTPVLLRTDAEGVISLADFGVYVEDATGGFWTLDSGADVLDAGGAAIAQPTVADILALSRDPGQEWRAEEIGFNPYAAIEVEAIGVRVTDSAVVDYTIEVTDQDGSFYVWARNLDRALELQFKTGDSREFNLRNFAVDFATLDEVGSSDDSAFRVELLTPGQFHFATSLGGFEFNEEMLSATLDNDTGLIDYRVTPDGTYTLSEFEYGSMIELVEGVFQQYVLISRRLAVRLALQDGLKEFAPNLEYNVEFDVFQPTTDAGLPPMFQAIFAGAPGSNADDAVFDYMVQWNAILSMIYPDHQPPAPKFFFDSTVGLDQTSVFQMALAAYETNPVDLDVFALANAFQVDESRVIIHDAATTELRGQEGVNFFYITEGDQTVIGSYDANTVNFDPEEVQIDIYYIGDNSGDDLIYDRDLGDQDQLRFTQLRSDEVRAVRDGEDLILFYNDGDDFVRLQDQFLGELNQILRNGQRTQTGVEEIIFADNVVWDRYRMSFSVVDFERAAMDEADTYLGSGSGDILFGGLGNDFLSGGAGGDTYLFRVGDGNDVINDAGSFSFGPVQAGLDFLMFRGDISENTIRLTRDGASENLLITILDDDGNETGDSVELVGQFGGVRLNLGAFSERLARMTGWISFPST